LIDPLEKDKERKEGEKSYGFESFPLIFLIEWTFIDKKKYKLITKTKYYSATPQVYETNKHREWACGILNKDIHQPNACVDFFGPFQGIQWTRPLLHTQH